MIIQEKFGQNGDMYVTLCWKKLKQKTNIICNNNKDSYSWCNLRFVWSWSWWGNRHGLHSTPRPWTWFSKRMVTIVGLFFWRKKSTKNKNSLYTIWTTNKNNKTKKNNKKQTKKNHRLTGEFEVCWEAAAVSFLFSALLPFLACWGGCPFSDDTLLASLSDKAPPKTVRTLWGRFCGSRLIFLTPESLPFHQVDGPGPDSRPLVSGKMSAWYSR